MAYSNKDIVDFLIANPNLTDADLAKVMETAGVSPAQIAAATGADEGTIAARVAATVPEGQAVLLGDTWVQPEYSVTGSGEDRQVGGITGVQTYKTSGGVNDQLPVGSTIKNYTPTGDFTGTSKTQKTESGFGEFLLGSAALFGGLGGGFEGLFGGGAGADAAALAADADIAGGLIPEFGTNAAYNGFMAGAMTPEALAAMDALVAANPEIIGSGALLTDAAAGLTPTVAPTGGTTTVTTTPTTTPTTPVTPTTPTVPPVIPPVVPPVIPPISLSDVVKTIGTVATVSALKDAATPKTTSTGFDIVPVPTDWTSPTTQAPSTYQPLTPINFGKQEMLRGTQFERMLDPNYGKVPTPVQYSQPSNLSYNDLMGILGSKQGMPSASNLSINDIISGIQNQYGQTPSGSMGQKPA